MDKPDSTVGNMKRSVSSFLGQVGSVLNPLPDDGDEEAILIQGDNHVFLNRLQVRNITYYIYFFISKNNFI